MPGLARAFVSLCLLALSPALACAQKEAPPVKTAKKATATRPGTGNPLAEQRRTTAITLISSLADEARSYQDATLRARVLARAADALWETDAERARNYFQRAWDAAESADAESQRLLEEDIRRQQRESGTVAVTSPPSLRNEVLRLAARRERALGEGFLKRIEESREREAEAAPAGSAPWMSTPTDSQRFRLALQLLEDGDVERALQFADRVLVAGNVTRDSIDFLSALREKDPKAADQRFMALLNFAAADDVVRAGNSAEGFTGEDARLSVTLRFRNGVMMNSVNATDFDLPSLFRGLAKDDLYRAIEVARTFTAEAPRANAHLAIARAVLDEKRK
jgi:hypothetical protein